MAYNERMSEGLAVVARIKPQTVTDAATAASDAVDMDVHRRVLFVFNMGDYAGGNDGSVVVKVQMDTDSGFGTAADLSGKALTTASFTGSALDDAVGIIEVTAGEMGSYRYCRLAVTPDNQNLTCSAVALADFNRYSRATDYDLAKVKEIIA